MQKENYIEGKNESDRKGTEKSKKQKDRKVQVEKGQKSPYKIKRNRKGIVKGWKSPNRKGINNSKQRLEKGDKKKKVIPKTRLGLRSKTY